MKWQQIHEDVIEARESRGHCRLTIQTESGMATKVVNGECYGVLVWMTKGQWESAIAEAQAEKGGAV